VFPTRSVSARSCIIDAAAAGAEKARALPPGAGASRHGDGERCFAPGYRPVAVDAIPAQRRPLQLCLKIDAGSDTDSTAAGAGRGAAWARIWIWMAPESGFDEFFSDYANYFLVQMITRWQNLQI
jgi:hypothetical protein